MEGPKHRIVVHLPTHTEHWYSTEIPHVGERFTHHDLDYEICSCRLEGASYVIEAHDIDAAVTPIPLTQIESPTMP